MKRLIIDVREPKEFETGHVEGAVNIPPSALLEGPESLKILPRDTEIIVYCVSGSRSNAASHILNTLGFKNITNGINKDQVKVKYSLNIV